MLSGIWNFLTGSGMKSIENIATEWIETDKEEAEAKALMVKTLDPNGLMRREISRRILSLYTVYVLLMCLLLGLEFFNYVPSGTSVEQMNGATSKLVELFLPITTMVGAIVSASFGINYSNIKQNK